MESGVEDVGDWAGRGVVGDNDIDNDDHLFMVVFIVIQLVMQWNKAALAVLNAVASSCSAAHPEMGEVLLLLAGGFLHNVSLVSAAMEIVNNRRRRRSRSMWVLDCHGGTWKDLQKEVMDAFERKGFPGCVGAIDGTHLYIEKPKNERAECYYDRTRQFSLVAQVVCEHECRIQDVFVGCPGSVHDSRAVRISHLYRDAQDGRGIFHGGTSFLHDGTPVRRYVLGDAGYPLLPWLMTPVGGDERTPQEVNFDDCHTSARSCIERTFALLKGVWRNFLRRQIGNMKTIMKEFMAVCILHNMMVDMRIDVDLDDLDSDDDDDQANCGNFRCRRRPRVQQAVQQPLRNRRDGTYGTAEGRVAKARLIAHVDHHVRVHGRLPANPWRQARAAP
ncbi:hypothetical protein CBR_g31205 [Chara braunii]|uniref:DDE Tnp4 domain-containing protein n=1 Tax=Chara braunii TaxID=69332 RepID=A0A388JXR9_CHABU|nr:hypothetical protein CBR_g31205 [Chara braunii]|eukprot:GBG62568.1 hypothetical protein CBR_g31205 [Chara braunii]